MQNKFWTALKFVSIYILFCLLFIYLGGILISDYGGREEPMFFDPLSAKRIYFTIFFMEPLLKTIVSEWALIIYIHALLYMAVLLAIVKYYRRKVPKRT